MVEKHFATKQFVAYGLNNLMYIKNTTCVDLFLSEALGQWLFGIPGQQHSMDHWGGRRVETWKN